MTGATKPEVCFLLPLWGQKYIDTFCEYSLRSLLAEGNLPALSREYRCKFTLLTRPEDVAYFESQPLFKTLREYCTINYLPIDDLLFPGSYSATLTIALERGIRSYGAAMTQHYFICLMADYLFGATALTALIPYLDKGYSVVTAGNYQVIEEDVRDYLTQQVNPTTGVIAIPNRALVKWSLNHLHPMSLANTVTATETHALHSNRLFWRVNDETIIGRFYLRHTLCIKPERTDYTIGAPWDYSFRSAMCPSSNAAHITDSDEYFLVELQPLNHEKKLITEGPVTEDFLSRSLSEWTTAEHRENIFIPVIYHAGDLPPHVQQAVAESAAYVTRISQQLSPETLPVSGHFYWLDSLHWITVNHALEPERYESLPYLAAAAWDSPVFGPALRKAGLSIDHFPPPIRPSVTLNAPVKRKIYQKLLEFYSTRSGYPLRTYWWFPPHLDFKMLADALESTGGTIGETLWIMPPSTARASFWPKNYRHLLRSPFVLMRDPSQLRKELPEVKQAVIFLPPTYQGIHETLVEKLINVVPSGGFIHVFMRPDGRYSPGDAVSVYKRGLAMDGRWGLHLVQHKRRGDGLQRRLNRSLHDGLNEIVRSGAPLYIIAWRLLRLSLLQVLFAGYTIANKIHPFEQHTRAADSFIISYKVA
jgi:hypothetical protein